MQLWQMKCLEDIFTASYRYGMSTKWSLVKLLLFKCYYWIDITLIASCMTLNLRTLKCYLNVMHIIDADKWPKGHLVCQRLRTKLLPSLANNHTKCTEDSVKTLHPPSSPAEQSTWHSSHTGPSAAPHWCSSCDHQDRHRPQWPVHPNQNIGIKHIHYRHVCQAGAYWGNCMYI